MKFIKRSIIVVISISALGNIARAVDEHKPIQGGTTNPFPTGPTDTSRPNDPRNDNNPSGGTIILAPGGVPCSPSTIDSKTKKFRKNTTKAMNNKTKGGSTTGSTGTGNNTKSGNLGGATSGSVNEVPITPCPTVTE